MSFVDRLTNIGGFINFRLDSSDSILIVPKADNIIPVDRTPELEILMGLIPHPRQDISQDRSQAELIRQMNKPIPSKDEAASNYLKKGTPPHKRDLPNLV